MVPTIPWMRQKFAEYNQRYFGGKLPTPEFAVTRLPGQWGKYAINDARYDKATRRVVSVQSAGVLYLTNAYSRNENSVISTLLHEMVHEYVYLILRVYPRDAHGQIFMNVAKNIIADGWNIEAETYETKEDVKDNGQNIEHNIICVINKSSGELYKWWICKATAENMQQVKATATKLKNVTSINFYEVASNALAHVESNPSTLFGWGGMTYQEAIGNLIDYCGASPNDFSPNVMKKI